jgi:hypothetical protein
MIMEVDAKSNHDNMLNAFRQSAAEAIVHRQEELLLDERFVAAEQAILSHNLHTHTIPHTYKTAMSSVNAVECLKSLIPKSISYNNLKRGIELTFLYIVCLNIDLIYYATADYIHKFHYDSQSPLYQLQ